MKYVRTKSGVIFPTKANEKDIDTSTYVKMADTIEELCDEFVAVNIKYNSCRLTDIRREKYYEPKIPMYYAGEHTHDFVDDYIKNKGLIYGAIWTDKGLIYVAKMNENGELELI